MITLFVKLTDISENKVGWWFVIFLYEEFYLGFLRNVNKQLSSPPISGYGPSDSLEDVVRLPDNSNKTEEDRCSNSADITGSFSH